MPRARRSRRKQTKQPAPQPRRQRKKAQQPRRAMQSNSGLRTQLAHAVCSLADPFCDAAANARWPDNNVEPSIPIRLRTAQFVTMSASGKAGIILAPGYEYQYGTGTLAGSTYTFTVLSGTAPSITASSYRITSWGFRLTCLSAPLNRSGFVTVIGLPALTNGAGLDAIDVSNLNRNFVHTISGVESDGFVCLGRPGALSARFYTGPASTNPDTDLTNRVPNGWCPMVVAFDGCEASATAYRIELVFNYEVLVDETSTLGSLAKKSPGPNSVLTNAVDKIQAGVSTMYDKNKDAIHKKVFDSAYSFLGSALTGAVNYLYGPVAGTAVGMLTNGSMAPNVD